VWYTTGGSPGGGGARFCGEPVDTLAPETIKSGKPNGVNPASSSRPRGRRFVLKTDGVDPAGAPDGCRLHGARSLRAGYHAACTRVVYFHPVHPADRSGAHQRREEGKRSPFRQRAHRRAVVRVAARVREGTVRASVQRVLRRPLRAPSRTAARRDGDPNDVVAHQHRPRAPRELLLAALESTTSTAREQTLSTSGGRPVPGSLHRAPHADLGDSFGSLFRPA